MRIQRNNNSGLSNVENSKFILRNNILWYPWIIFSLLNAIYFLFTYLYMIINQSFSLSTNSYIIILFLFLFSLFIGLMQKSTKRTFLISSKEIGGKKINIIEYSHKLGLIKVGSKDFNLDNVKRFEIIQRKRPKGPLNFAALFFKSGKYLIVTSKRDEPIVHHITKMLNIYLSHNTAIDKQYLIKELIPIETEEERERYKKNSIIKLVLFISFAISGIFFTFSLVFSILGVFSTVFIIVSFTIGTLLTLSLNGASLHGL